MEVGNLGPLITFKVSSKKVLTFSDMSSTAKGRWASHEVVMKKAKSEFLGPDLRQITFKIFLSSTQGVKPRKTIERIEKAVEKGTPFIFVIGGKKVGKHQWVIENMSDTWDEIIEDGHLVSASATLVLREYV